MEYLILGLVGAALVALIWVWPSLQEMISSARRVREEAESKVGCCQSEQPCCQEKQSSDLSANYSVTIDSSGNVSGLDVVGTVVEQKPKKRRAPRKVKAPEKIKVPRRAPRVPRNPR